MIKVKIELVPWGIRSVTDTWEGHIWNDLSGNATKGNYTFRIFQKNSTEKIWKIGHISGFKRKQWSVWYLLYLVLRMIYDGR